MSQVERFPLALVHAAATLYYLEDATQVEIADRIGTSRSTVSRLLRDARVRGLVRIEVPPLVVEEPGVLAHELAAHLGIEKVWLCDSAPQPQLKEAISSLACEALASVGLQPGEVLLVSSGRTVYEIANRSLPPLPGVVVAPMVGGQEEPEPWYQTNEITRRMAQQVNGSPRFLHAPALPGKALHRGLMQDPHHQDFAELWKVGRCAFLGIGAPPLRRQSLPSFLHGSGAPLGEAAGDIATRFFDSKGEELLYDSVERLVAISFDSLRAVPVKIAVAYGSGKATSVAAAAKAGLLNNLVTDSETATAILSGGQERTL